MLPQKRSRGTKTFSRFYPCKGQNSARTQILALTKILAAAAALFSRSVWLPTRGLPLGTDCLIPALVPTRRRAAASVKVGLPQGTELCPHF